MPAFPSSPVSPIIGGAAVEGAAARDWCASSTCTVSPLGIGRQYRDFLDLMLVDATDAQLLGEARSG